MLHKLKQRESEGFTIIEVLIVLAIAGLILLIVFLAVPNLQRNGRNTAIKTDASTLGGGISDFEGQNGGAAPTGGFSNGGDGTLTLTGAPGTIDTKIKISAGTAVSLNASTSPLNGGTLIDPATAGKLVVYSGYTCDGSASTRAFAIVYDIETSGGLAAQCFST